MEPHVEQLIVKHLSGETTPAEEAQLREWLDREPAHRETFEAHQQLWLLTRQQPAIDPQTEREWQNFAQQAFREAKPAREHETFPQGRRPLTRWPVYGLAAAVTLLLLCTILLVSRPGNTLLQTLSQREVRADSLRELRLPDGTLVWLNRRSTLRYPRWFGGSAREVYLEGEAFFAVEKDARRPFRILAGRAVTEVLGTSFNVRAYPEAQAVEVVVASGKVRLGGESTPDRAVQLTAGWTGTYQTSTGHTSRHPRTDPNYLSWKTGRLVFENTPAAEVLAALGRHYGITVTLQNQEIANHRVTTAFAHQPLGEALDEIALLLDLTYRRTESTVIFSSNNP
jgi:ferric-dicitrate binding protein FerR (iron transport regulator)